MKKIFTIFFVLNCSFAFSQQTKYAVILSRLPIAVGAEKEIARNNLNTIVNALLIQGFEKQNIFYDTSTLTRKSVFTQLDKLVANLKQKDFAFLYVDLPVRIQPGTVPVQKFLLNKVNEEEFVLVTELENFLKNTTIKINDRSLIFSFFDTPPLQLQTTLNALFSGLTEHGRYRGQTDNYEYGNFAKTLAEVITSGSTFLLNYRSLEQAVQNTLAQYNTWQEPFMRGYLDDPLFNGQFIRYPVHFEIKSITDPSTVIINGGESVDILPGARVKLYNAFTDTSSKNLITEGRIQSVGRFTSTVNLNSPLQKPGEKVWAYIIENDKDSSLQRIRFNTSFTGTPKTEMVFNSVIEKLKQSRFSSYIKFVDMGGDVGIKEITIPKTGAAKLTFAHPVSLSKIQEILWDDKNDMVNMEDLIKKLARYLYLSRIRNERPELNIGFRIEHNSQYKSIESENGYPVLYEGDSIQCTLINKNPVRLYYAVIDMQPDMVMNMIFPSQLIPPEDCFIEPNSTRKLTSLQIVLYPPYGKERFKIISSLEPISLELVESLIRGTSSRSRDVGVTFRPELCNIQNFDFEIRNPVYRKVSPTSAIREILSTDILKANNKSYISAKLTPGNSPGAKVFSIENNSGGKIYFNVFRQKKDGTIEMMLPNLAFNESACAVDSNNKSTFFVQDSLQAFDPFITVCTDRPFRLDKYVGKDRQLNELITEIMRSGAVEGSPLNKIAVLSALYTPGMGTVSRDGEKVYLRVITPTISGERSGTVKVVSPGFTIMGLAMTVDSKPIKSVMINGEEVNYNPFDKFFEGSVLLSKGMNRITITAKDEMGFLKTEKFDVLLESNEVFASRESRNLFLGIGIDNYKTWDHLNNAKNDIRGFSNLLKKKFGFTDSNMVLLMDTMATRDNIMSSIRDYLSKAGTNDNLIIYLSGHGNEDGIDEGGYHFIPQEAQSGKVSTYVSSADIMSPFKKIKARHCILIIDACYSGMITNDVQLVNSQRKSSQAAIDPELLPSKWVITSGGATKVKDGEPGKNSPFAMTLLEYLSENNDETKLTITQLIKYLKDIVPKRNPAQQPSDTKIDGLGEFKFRVSH